MKLSTIILLATTVLSSNVMAMKSLSETPEGITSMGRFKACEDYLRSTQQWDRAEAMQYAYFEEQKASGYNGFQNTLEFRKGKISQKMKLKKSEEARRECHKIADYVADQILASN